MKLFRLLLIGLFFTILTNNSTAGEKIPVQFIAIHFGDASYAEVLDQSQFPEIKFYTCNGDVYGYTEQQKIVGNPDYLMGWYGEVPEKMGFGANYRAGYEKYYGFPYLTGSIYVIDKNGTIYYQSDDGGTKNTSNKISFSKALNSVSKGKETKLIKEKKREYVKSTAVGELEPRKKCEIDKEGEGLMGWPVPDLMIKDSEGNEVSLATIVKGKATVLVFYTMNGVEWKKGNAKGEIKEQWKGCRLMSPETYEKLIVEEFEKNADENKSGAANAAKFMGNEALKAMSNRQSIQDIWSAEGDLPDDQKVSAYIYFSSNLHYVNEYSNQD